MRLLAVRAITLLLWATPVHAACPSSAQDVFLSVNAAMSAYAAMDILAYQAARGTAMADLVCVREPVTPIDAAALHRLSGLDAYVRGTPEIGTGAFRAALAIQPAFQLPSTMVPEGHPLRQWYEDARAPSPLADTGLTAQTGTQIYVDGVPATRIRAGSAAVLQWIDASGEVRETAYQAPGAPLPWWARPTAAVSPAPALPAAPPPTVAARRPGRLTAPLFGGAAVFGVSSGALYALALTTRGTWAEETTPYEDLDALRRRTNAETIGAAAGGVLAVALGVAGVVTLRW